MITVEFVLEGASPIMFGKEIGEKKEANEAHDDFEQRIWRERLHYDANDEVFIPPDALKGALDNVAKFLSETVPGKGKATYTKHFKSGIMVIEPVMLGVKKKDVPCIRRFVSSTGKPGGPRVWRHFPILNSWSGRGEIVILDPILIAKPEKVEEYLSLAGKFIGLLMWGPRSGRYFGRYAVKDFKVKKGK